MNVKEIKSALKSAKESLDQKDYKSAIKQCKAILKSDRNNYLALVFYGAAAQETEQKDEAPKAFRKAIEISPEQILAWRGLACYYEKAGESAEPKDVIQVYEKLLMLENDPLKFSEALDKLQKLCVSHFDTGNIKFMEQFLVSADAEKKILVHQYLVHVLESNLSEEFISLYGNSLQYLFSLETNADNRLETLKKYIKHLYKFNNPNKVLELATSALESFPDNITFLEWICKVYTELPDEKLNEMSGFSPKDAYTKLLDILPNSYLAHFCKGLHEFQMLDFVNACNSLKKAAHLKSNSGLIWLKLSSCQLFLWQWENAEESSLNSLKHFENTKKNENFIFSCEKNLLMSLCEQENEDKLTEAVMLGFKLQKLNLSHVKVLECLTKSLIKLKRFSEAEKCIVDISKCYEGDDVSKYLNYLICKEKGEIEKGKSILEELVVKSPNYFEPCLELGKTIYHENNPNCLLHLLKSAKLNQWCYWCFFYLGHCYATMVNDLDKARRCYQKAYQLNPSSIEVGKCLSDIYRILGKEDLNLELLTAVTEFNSRSKWAWLKLGLHYLSVNQHQEAVNSLQAAVRLDPNDNTAWECLGDAYFAQGAPTSSIKSYQKAIELNGESVYPMLQIAKIKHSIGLHQESVEEFRILNEKMPNYVPALKGHAEACLLLMRQHLAQNLNGLAADDCQEAVIQLTKCLEQQKNLLCIWKLLGDCCTLLSNLPEKYCNLKVPSWLYRGLSNPEGVVTLNKLEVLKLASRCFCQAILINQNFSNLWYDLAHSYNVMVNFSKTKESKKQMRQLACSAVMKSILLNGDNWENWNLYGIILASEEIQNYYLAQHCFIKAIQKLDTNAVTWTNLGTLYLMLNDLPIANQSFTEAQKFDHDYVSCWVGQAIIAQRTEHHDAMDLFRHSTKLGFTTEGCLGYSNSVCYMLLNEKNKSDKNYLYSIENMNAVMVATDLLTWYTDRFPENAWAFNMLGLLLERRMLHRSSATAFCRALNLIQSEESDRGEKRDQIILNYARVLSRLKKFDEALLNLKQIKKATFANQCELAAAYFRAKLYEEAYSTYESALEWLAPDTETKSHILVAMAAVVYLHQGQEDAKILLMQSLVICRLRYLRCQLKPASVQGLFACCALGMLHSDLALSELALKELDAYMDDFHYISHIAVFRAYIYLFKGQRENAVRALCGLTHRHPGQSLLWLNLSILLLHLYATFGSGSAAKCAEVALITGRSSIDVSKVMSLVSLSNLLSGKGSESLKSSQKAVHMFPDVTENWVVLVASVLSKCLQTESPEEVAWLDKMITYIRRKSESSRAMTQWLSNNNRKIREMAENLVFCLLVIAFAVASAGLIYSPAYIGSGAYGAHSPFAVSYSARVDAPRHDVLVAGVPYAPYVHY